MSSSYGSPFFKRNRWPPIVGAVLGSGVLSIFILLSAPAVSRDELSERSDRDAPYLEEQGKAPTESSPATETDSHPGESRPLDFMLLNTRGLRPNHIPSQTITFTSEEQWVAFGQKYEWLEQPSVDFSQHLVAAIFLGQRGSTGYGVRIVAVERSEDAITVHYEEVLPDPSRGYGAMVSHPYEMVLLPRVVERVVFREVGAKS